MFLEQKKIFEGSELECKYAAETLPREFFQLMFMWQKKDKFLPSYFWWKLSRVLFRLSQPQRGGNCSAAHVFQSNFLIEIFLQWKRRTLNYSTEHSMFAENKKKKSFFDQETCFRLASHVGGFSLASNFKFHSLFLEKFSVLLNIKKIASA